MFVAFALEALGIFALSRFGQNPVLFVVLSGTVFLFWGEIFSLFPATVGDVFGSRYATTNTGMMYTAKGTAALLVPYGNALRDATGSWEIVFNVIIALNVFASLSALLLLKPMIRARVRAEAPARDAVLEPVA
jgi:OFA family oxalate/formate antiporter-like MFS transporter